MMDEVIVQQLLSVSALLFKHLTNVPEDSEERDGYIAKIDELLDQRGSLMNKLKQSDSNILEGHQLTTHLIELDKGINIRLQNVMDAIKKDMSDLQKTKKSEQKYANPYSAIQTMDGMYYDGKK